MDFLRAIMEIKRHEGFGNGIGLFNMALSFNGYVVTDDSWRQKELQSPWSRVYYVIDGEGMFVQGGKEIPIEAGYAYLAPCGLSYGFYGKKPITKLFFHVNVIKPDGYDLFASPDSKIVRFERSREEMERLVSCYFSDDPMLHMRLKAELMKTVSEAAEAMWDSGSRSAVH